MSELSELTPCNLYLDIFSLFRCGQYLFGGMVTVYCALREAGGSTYMNAIDSDYKEGAHFAHSFHLHLLEKHQLMHQLYTSALPWMMCWSWLIYLTRIFEKFTIIICAHVHILTDYVILSIS